MQHSRRKFLALAGMVPVAVLAGVAAQAQSAAACYDPASLPLSQRTRRRSLGYVEQSGDSAKSCGRCAFFTATQAGCGTCQLLAAGPVNAGALCNSYAPKAA